jgi:hypothetical protein
MEKPYNNLSSRCPSEDNDSTNHDDDILEKMLKEAEELAMKMSRNSSGSNASSSRPGSVVSTDCANSNDDHVLLTNAIHNTTNTGDSIDDGDEHDDHYDGNGNMFSGSLDDHLLEKDGNSALEDILKKSETLLSKMKSRTTSIGGGGGNGTKNKITNNNDINAAVPQSSPFGRAPSPSGVCPPKSSPPAPSSVYLLDPTSIDDVSSVGSGSLLSPSPSPAGVALKVPNVYMTPAGRPIREDESLLMSIVQPFVLDPTIADDDNDGNNNNNKEKTTPNVVHSITPPRHPTPLRNTNGLIAATTGGVDISLATPTRTAVVSPSLRAVGTTTSSSLLVSSPEARWEKVQSANVGDDDYVPLVDYSEFAKSPLRPVVVTSASSLSSLVAKGGSYTSSPSSIGREERNKRSTQSSVLSIFMGGGTGKVTTTSTSRVAAFRAHEKKRRKRQRQIKVAAVFVTCILAGAYYYYYYYHGSTTPSKGAGGGLDKTADVTSSSGGVVVGNSAVPRGDAAATVEIDPLIVSMEESRIDFDGEDPDGTQIGDNNDEVDRTDCTATSVAGTFTNDHDENGDAGCRMEQNNIEIQLPVDDEDGEDDGSDGVQKQHQDVKGATISGLYLSPNKEKDRPPSEVLSDDPTDADVLLSKKRIDVNKKDDKTMDEQSFGTPLSNSDECSSGRLKIHLPDPSPLERTCKNPIQRIFNRQCRILARGRKRRHDQAHVLNLLSKVY